MSKAKQQKKNYYTVDDLPYSRKACPHCGKVSEKRWNHVHASVMCLECHQEIRVYHEAEL